MHVLCVASIKIPAYSSFLLLLSIFSLLYNQLPTFFLHATLTVLCPHFTTEKCYTLPLKFEMVT